MAHSLFHELLHVWFMHAHRRAGTGHSGDVMHPGFAKQLDAVTLELEKLEPPRRRCRGPLDNAPRRDQM